MTTDPSVLDILLGHASSFDAGHTEGMEAHNDTIFALASGRHATTNTQDRQPNSNDREGNNFDVDRTHSGHHMNDCSLVQVVHPPEPVRASPQTLPQNFPQTLPPPSDKQDKSIDVLKMAVDKDLELVDMDVAF